ncbi:hypothetical protein F2Q70_00021354 [Brassica cretica]|uniref:Putative plant transposon protein domain-containing protein n=2 Tax=Brassica cretica TaxID=69181 RepID=A0A3N6STN0_BRACR|nr:hypothetical protein F2Q70_00021354 [Brassica cretica]KAF2559448.1 hypothetical protein F2Q68_00014827 [Brassica cretica]KAF3608535.1 hypothetical protein DY000_02047585 [Brassica cretica]
MTEQSHSSTDRSRRRRFSEVDYSFGEHYHFRSQVLFISFNDRLQISRLLFSNTVPTIGGYSRRHHNEEALSDDVFRIIDSIGWSYTVMHVHPFCPRVVREFISNKPFNDEGALIRGYVFQFTPSVINRLMMTPSVEHSFEWREVDLNQAISHLTGGQCSGWTGFDLNALPNPFQVLYRVCELNWLPGPDFDSMIKNRLRLLYAVANRNNINFGHLLYDQVVEMTHKTNWDTNLIFPNLIYQLLMLHNEVPLLPGDEEPIGRGLPIYGLAGDTSGPRGHSRLY